MSLSLFQRFLFICHRNIGSVVNRKKVFVFTSLVLSVSCCFIKKCGFFDDGFLLWLELDQLYFLRLKALITDPLGENLSGEHDEGSFVDARADSVEPEVAARLAQDSLVVLVYLKKIIFALFINYDITINDIQCRW